SGLVCPGLGHLVLKKYRRGSALIIVALVAVSVIVIDAFQRALTVVDRINSGEIPLDTSAINAAIADSTGGGDSLRVSIAVIVFIGCWLFGIIDSYRIGSVAEPTESTAD
ncbi:MAG: hypothetical protein OEN51_08615, partial [Gammaproteobacteria bacterium]|nr:hypothetical protein [Gammaproteobacteria bacterium]